MTSLTVGFDLLRAPRKWPLKRLKYGVSLITRKGNNTEKDGRFVGLEHIESWTGRLVGPTPDVEINEPDSDGGGTCFCRNDVLFGKSRPYLAKVYAAEFDGVCSGELLVFRPRDFDTRFLRYLLLTPEVITAVDSSTYGAKMPRANWSFIGSLMLPVPPRDQQIAIADYLDRETARIDYLIARQEHAVQLLEEQRFATIAWLTTKASTTP